MTIAQKMFDERRQGYREGLAEGRTENQRKNVLVLREILDPEVIARQFEMPLEEVLEILRQED